MNDDQMKLVLAAIGSALLRDDRQRAINLATAGLTMLSGGERERMEAWQEIEQLAGLASGSGNAP